MKSLRLTFVLLLCAVQAFGGTITGFIQTPTGGAVAGGTLTFKLSQGAILSGTASVTAQQVSCYTTNTGGVVGVPDAAIAPILSGSTGAGSLPAGNYYVKIYYIGAGGVGIASPEASVNLASMGEIQVSAPALEPSSATGYGVAIGTTSGGETIQTTVTGWSNYTATSLVSGAAPPSSNTSSCSLAFSDQLIPTGTSYTVNLLSKSGSQVAGYPQTWCLYGGLLGTINISNGAPLGNCGSAGVYYPTPLWSNPPSGATVQSLSTGLNMGSNPLTVGNITSSGGFNLSGVFLANGITSTNGAIIDVSGNACTMPLQLVNVDTGPTNPNKYFRINQTTGALEIVNSACNGTIFSLDDLGNIANILSISGGRGGTVFISSPLTFTAVGTLNDGIPGDPFSGNGILMQGANAGTNAASYGAGGGITLNGGARCNNVNCETALPFGSGRLGTNSYFSTYNTLSTKRMGLSPLVAVVDLTVQSATLGGGATASSLLYAAPTYTADDAPVPQEYLLSWNAKVTTAGSVSSTLGPLTIKYTDPDGVAQTITCGAQTSAGAVATTSTGNATTTVLLGLPILINAQPGSNITYGFTYTSNAAATMAYNLHMTLEAK